jgi:hypothetical protein
MEQLMDDHLGQFHAIEREQIRQHRIVEKAEARECDRGRTSVS